MFRGVIREYVVLFFRDLLEFMFSQIINDLEVYRCEVFCDEIKRKMQ